MPEDAISRECKSLNISYPSKSAKKGSFKSTINIVAPTQKALELLAEFEKNCIRNPKILKISYIEIVRDKFFGSKEQAELESEIMALTVLKKWPRRSEKFNAMDMPGYDFKPYIGKGLLPGTTSRVIGGKNRDWVNYTRISKFYDQWCSHEEWRISGASKVKSKVNISRLSDLVDFDFEAFFERQDQKYMRFYLVDYYNLGRWLVGWTRKRKFSDKEKRHLLHQAHALCRANKISSPADLVDYFCKIKDQLKTRRGRRSKSDEKVLKLRSYKNFFKKYDLDEATDRLCPLGAIMRHRAQAKRNA